MPTCCVKDRFTARAMETQDGSDLPVASAELRRGYRSPEGDVVAQLNSASHKTSRLFCNILPFHSISDFELIFPILQPSPPIFLPCHSFNKQLLQLMSPQRTRHLLLLYAICWGRSKCASLCLQVSGGLWQNWPFFRFLPRCFCAL